MAPGTADIIHSEYVKHTYHVSIVTTYNFVVFPLKSNDIDKLFFVCLLTVSLLTVSVHSHTQWCPL